MTEEPRDRPAKPPESGAQIVAKAIQDAAPTRHDRMLAWLSTLSNFIVAITALLVAFFTYVEIKPALDAFQRATGLTMTYPIDGQAVGAETAVAGTSTRRNGFVQVVVRTPEGVEYVQRKSVEPTATGEWQTTAQFGEGTAGCGDVFLVRSVWSKESLGVGPTRSFPDSAMFSKEISVFRKCEDP